MKGAQLLAAAAAKKLGFRWAPFMFPFWGVGSDGGAAAKGLGARHVSFLRLPPLVHHKAGLHRPPFAVKAAPITKLPS